MNPYPTLSPAPTAPKTMHDPANKIEAIKIIRAWTDAGLKDSKQAIEAACQFKMDARPNRWPQIILAIWWVVRDGQTGQLWRKCLWHYGPRYTRRRLFNWLGLGAEAALIAIVDHVTEHWKAK